MHFFKTFSVLGLMCALGLAGCTEGQFEERRIDTSNLTRLENADARIDMLRATIAQNPQDLGALKTLGAEYEAQARWPEAASAYREALILASSDRTALVGYSKALAAQGTYASALVEAEKAISRGPGADAYVAAGVANDGMGKQAEAQAYYEKALSGNKRDLDVRSNIALSKALQGDPNAYALMSGVALAPDADARHQANMVLVSALLGRLSDARAYGAKFGLSKKEVNEILKIATNARSQGAVAFGVARKG